MIHASNFPRLLWSIGVNSKVNVAYIASNDYIRASSEEKIGETFSVFLKNLEGEVLSECEIKRTGFIKIPMEIYGREVDVSTEYLGGFKALEVNIDHSLNFLCRSVVSGSHLYEINREVNEICWIDDSFENKKNFFYGKCVCQFIEESYDHSLNLEYKLQGETSNLIRSIYGGCKSAKIDIMQIIPVSFNKNKGFIFTSEKLSKNSLVCEFFISSEEPIYVGDTVFSESVTDNKKVVIGEIKSIIK